MRIEETEANGPNKEGEVRVHGETSEENEEEMQFLPPDQDPIRSGYFIKKDKMLLETFIVSRFQHDS